MQGVASTTPVAIKGEAYKIEREVKFPQEGLNGVDFGLVRGGTGGQAQGMGGESGENNM